MDSRQKNRFCQRCNKELNENQIKFCINCSNATLREASNKRFQKAARHSAGVKKVDRGYGGWKYLLGDKPVRQRDDILWETVATQATKNSIKFTGNQ
jgi:hypothetical protein